MDRITVGAVIALLRERDPEATFLVYSPDGTPEFDEPVLITTTTTVYIGQRCRGPDMSVAVAVKITPDEPDTSVSHSGDWEV